MVKNILGEWEEGISEKFNSPLLIDIYVACVSSAHSVCAKDYYIAIVSTIVETDSPERECDAGLNLLGPILEK